MDTPPMTAGTLIAFLRDYPTNTPLRLVNLLAGRYEYDIGEPIDVDIDGVTTIYLTVRDQVGPLPSRAAVLLRWADEDRGMHFPEEP